jgi:hypothetical protein
MKRVYFFLFFNFLCFYTVVFGVGEKIISIGSSSGWEVMERRTGVTEVSLVRSHPVLALAARLNRAGFFADDSIDLTIDSAIDSTIDPAADLSLSFDEKNPLMFADAKGRYAAAVSPALVRSGRPWTRAGEGAARFRGAEASAGSPLVLRPKQEALFGPGKMIGDFSIEFWLFPMNMENGEQILTWTSSKPDGRGGYITQRIECEALKNRFRWTFTDLFSTADGRGGKTISLTGTVVLPRTWSHHLIRFNADLGLLEYLVNGRIEALDYATSSGREGGDVYVPVIGEDGAFVLGGRFAGIIDEFRIYGRYLENPSLVKYPHEGGRAESMTLDLGGRMSHVLRIETLGGRISGGRISGGRISDGTRSGSSVPEHIYTGNGSLRFTDHSEIQIFVRANDTPYKWNDVPWIPVEPGADLPEGLSGRYIQVAAAFYPSGDGETTPYLDELRITYRTAEPPPPPTMLTAIARDGAVELSWRASPGRDIGGYLIYYGISSGEYFGDHAILEDTTVKSPVNAGNRTAVRIEGLKNGTLYYFAVAAYSAAGGGQPEPGMFSREAAARPLQETPLSPFRAEVRGRLNESY